MQKIITLVGGAGAMGQLFAKYLGLSSLHIIRILDQDNWHEAPSLLDDCDLVIVCVPINSTFKVISDLALYLKPATILADFTSVKTPVVEHMLKLHTGPVLGLHPIFGPTIASPNAQIIVNCGGRYVEKSAWLIENFKSMGFRIVEMDTASHDQMMGFIQGIEHFSTFALGLFLHKYEQHPEQLFNLSSPIYQAKLALLGRIFDQDAALYADIIMADKARIELIADYVNHLQNWVEKLKNNDKHGFIQEFLTTKEWMGKFTHDAQLASDKFLTTITNSFITARSKA